MSLDSISLREQILCTGAGAIITSVCTTPLDVIKVRLQSQHKFKSLSSKPSVIAACNCSRLFSNSFCLRQEHTISHASKELCLNVKRKSYMPAMMKSTMNTAISVVRSEGLTSLWSGLSPTLLMSVPGTMIYYTAYDQIKHRLGYDQSDSKNLFIPVVAGALSRVAAVIVVSPLELLRTKMQSTRMSYTKLYAATRLSIKINGSSIFFKGLVPTLLRDVPFSVIYWLSYESIKLRLKNGDCSQSHGVLKTFASGAFSGLLAAFLTCPFDVVKTHRQIELGEVSSLKKHNTSTWYLLQNLYKSKGIQGLYAGVVPRMIKVAPACAIMISVYEAGKAMLCKYDIQKSLE